MKNFFLCFLVAIGSFGIMLYSGESRAGDISQPCPLESNIILNGIDYSDISALRDDVTFYGWDIESNSIYTWWDPVSSGGIDIWVEYEANLTKGNWNIGLCAINYAPPGHDGLGNDPGWYPQFELSNSLTDDIIIVPASDTSLNSGYFNFEVPTDGLYSVRFRWLNDKAEGTRPDGRPILDANIKIVRVFFDIKDTDGDGIPDDEDVCPFSDLSDTVEIDECDSDVDNLLLEDGCTISDLISKCADDAKNHGKFVRCVSHLTNDLKKDGIISGKEKGKIQSCAAKADIP